MRDSTARRLSQLHAAIYRVSRGRLGSWLVSNDMLVLTTKGRTSGKPHRVPLLYLRENTTFVVVASWGGRDYHPDWYLNLVAEPEATVNLRGASRSVAARVAEEEERVEWMQRAVAAHPGYEEYQLRTDRRIPIVFLVPA